MRSTILNQSSMSGLVAVLVGLLVIAGACAGSRDTPDESEGATTSQAQSEMVEEDDEQQDTDEAEASAEPVEASAQPDEPVADGPSQQEPGAEDETKDETETESSKQASKDAILDQLTDEDESEEASGRLSRSEIRTTVGQYRDGIAECGERENQDELTGRLMMRMVIQPSGDVSDVAITTSKFEGTDVGECVQGVVEDMEFPEAETDITVNYPFPIR